MVVAFLPRPRVADVKFKDERVDPPLPVMDSLMASVEGLRLQGRIDGNLEKLQKKDTVRNTTPNQQTSHSLSPPPAPVRRRVVGLLDEEEKRGLVRKLGDDFDRAARESGMAKKGSESGGAEAAKARSKDDRRQGKKGLVQGVRKFGATGVSTSGIRSFR